MKYEAVIGLEVHTELLTQSKLFCSCATLFGKEPNTQTCPICLGHPGTLPVLNRQAVVYGLRTALALQCTPAERSWFDRKNYTYPDLPKAYQVSQFQAPLGEHGYIHIPTEQGEKRIGITRLHLEEDAGKLLHTKQGNVSLIDGNRAGIPLLEIVSEPDLRSPAEAKAYLEELRLILLYLGVSDGKMEEGSLRCDANVSLRPLGSTRLGTKTEMKNLNSFRFLEKALHYEIERQAELLASGGSVEQVTLRFNELTGMTELMRTKEDAHDYRYFPEPDLVEIHIDEQWQRELRASLPELPAMRRQRNETEWKIPAADMEILLRQWELGDFFIAAVEAGAPPTEAANWLVGEVLGRLHAMGKPLSATGLTPLHLAEMITLLNRGIVGRKLAKSLLEEILTTGRKPADIVEERGWGQIRDATQLQQMVQEIVAANPQSVADIRMGKERARGFLVGQVMRKTQGRAEPKVVQELLNKALAAAMVQEKERTE